MIALLAFFAALGLMLWLAPGLDEFEKDDDWQAW